MTKTKRLAEGLSLNPYPHIIIEDYFEEDITETIDELVSFELEVREKQNQGDMREYKEGDKSFKSATFLEAKDLAQKKALLKIYDHFNSESFRTEISKVLGPYSKGRLKISPEEIISISKNSDNFFLSLKLSGTNVPKLRGAHVDGAGTIMTFLYYLRIPNDFSTGGNFLLHEKENPPNQFAKFILKVFRKVTGIEFFNYTKSVEYKANTFVAILNGPDSIHEISRRRNASVNRVAFHGAIICSKDSF